MGELIEAMTESAAKMSTFEKVALVVAAFLMLAGCALLKHDDGMGNLYKGVRHVDQANHPN